MHVVALTLRGCMWSLMDLYALGFLCTLYWLYCLLSDQNNIYKFKALSPKDYCLIPGNGAIKFVESEP